MQLIRAEEKQIKELVEISKEAFDSDVSEEPKALGDRQNMITINGIWNFRKRAVCLLQ